MEKPCKISYSRFGDPLNCFSLGNSIRWSQKNRGIWMRSVIGKNWNKSSIRLDTSSSNHQFAVLVLIDWRYIIQVFIDDIANSTKTEKNPCGYFFVPCKRIQDSLGFWIPSCRFRIAGTGFRTLWVEFGFRIPIVNGISDSLSCIPDSKTHFLAIRYSTSFIMLRRNLETFESSL